MCQVHHHLQQRWAEDRQECQITSGKRGQHYFVCQEG